MRRPPDAETALAPHEGRITAEPATTEAADSSVTVPDCRVQSSAATPARQVQRLTADQQAGLDVARDLARAGVPIFLAEPNRQQPGKFHLPPRWQHTTPDPTVLDRWQPGMAVCAVMGTAVDGLDIDPRHGGDATADGLREAGMWPRSYGRAATPSGGSHDLIAPLRAGSRDAVRPGMDVKGGRPGAVEDAGRGFLFIDPTVGLDKTTREPRAYRWEVTPNLDALADDDDDTGDELAHMVREALAGAVRQRRSEQADTAGDAPAYDDLDPAMRASVDRYVDRALASIAAELRAMQAWPEGHSDTNGRGWEKGTSDAFRAAARLARARWNALTLAEARAACLDAAPTSSTWTRRDVETKWEQQSHRGEPRPWPTALDDDTDDIVFMSGSTDHDAVEKQDTEADSSWRLDEANLTDRVARDVLAGRFCWSAGLGWMRWDGRRWASAPEAAVIEAVRRYFIGLHSRAARRGASVETLKLLSGLLWRNRIANVVSLARGTATVLADAASFDAHPDLLNVGNGVVDLDTGELLPHDPALRLTRLTPVDYDPAAEHPDWTAAGAAVPPEVLDCLQVRLGQATSGHMTPDDVLLVLQGGGQNAKSTLTGAVQAALGEHAVLVSDRVLLASPDAHPTELMELRGARFALIEETPEARRLSVARLKKTVGTPLITARHIRQDSVTFPATHTLVLTSNYRPQIEETDHGTWRRLALVVFPFTFRAPGEPIRSDNDRPGDPGLRSRLLGGAAQQRAVLRWLVDGARRWYAADRVLPPLPARVATDTLAWRTEADHVLGYITERLVLTPDSHVMSTDLLSDFNGWVESRGLRPWGDQTLSERFGSHGHVGSAGVQKRRMSNATGLSRPMPYATHAPARAMAWVGVRFRTDSDDAADARTALQATPSTPLAGVAGVSGLPAYGVSHTTYPSTPATPASEVEEADCAPF